MKIYTYYENVNFANQLELIEVWKESWKIGGFEPVVLNRADAKKSRLFNDYYIFVQRVHEKSVGITLPENNYWLAAQLEIVAFSTIEEPSFFSDYDVINNGYKKFIPEDKIYWRDNACSSFMTGGKKGWESYIKFLFQNEDLVIDFCKQMHREYNRIYFGDQDFLISVYRKGIELGVFNGSRNINIIGAKYKIDSDNTCQAIHISHENIREIMESNPKFSHQNPDQLRLMFAKNVLRDFKNRK